ncbi:hypothetical protein GQ53DRAFT_885379 [Thozetella sp. PMI_491]|nr:hypothetical protein GQ53DRAFT_885379 [Thozetella sp. PMI_491]
MASVVGVQFEHYLPANTVGVHETKPRLSWNLEGAKSGFQQLEYEVELSEGVGSHSSVLATAKVVSSACTLTPWPFDIALKSRQRISVRVRLTDSDGQLTPWSEPARLETGLLSRGDWKAERVALPGPPSTQADPERLFRKAFSVTGEIDHARLYVTAQGVYEAEINGQRVGDYFLAPGWTAYDGRLQYQTYDVTAALSQSENVLGVRAAEGWFSGRLGWDGGFRNIWGDRTAVLAQLEITYTDGSVDTVASDSSWETTLGPIRLAELYDGEKYDATLEVPNWSQPGGSDDLRWEPVLPLPPLSDSIELTAGYGEPVRRIQLIQPVERIRTPSGKIIFDFGQNLVGVLRLKGIQGPRGHKITLSHAEVLEHGELGTRPLRECKAQDTYTLKGAEGGEQYEPRFTFHGFRYAQIDNWPGGEPELSSAEAVVCHTDMKPAGSFSCSDPLLNKLYQNIVWGMRGNFLSVPTDCPQRDERLGWTGDLALFAPTAVLIYDCYNMLKNWLIDLWHDQRVLDGVPPMVSPNSTIVDPVWLRKIPCAIWHDVTIMAPWDLYQETGDPTILSQQYDSMLAWMEAIPKNKTGATHLWDPAPFQLGDWLDPAAPPDQPWKSPTDNRMVSNMFLVQSLDLMVKISEILGREEERASFETEARAARAEFQDEYVTKNGRLVSDTQAAYALAICLNLLTPEQEAHAGARLAEIVRKNQCRIATGFAGTPFLCRALARTGHIQVAYAMLLEKECPSWLYPVTMGATTVWERWNSMLPDGSINPGKMTSFNHYAFGAVAKFMYEQIAGLQRLDPGWKRFRIAPAMGAAFTRASAEHVAPTGTITVSWEASTGGEGPEIFSLKISVPHGTTAEVVLPEGDGGQRQEVVGPGDWSFETTFKRTYTWPLPPVPEKF